jgi:hypothetical protein
MTHRLERTALQNRAPSWAASAEVISPLRSLSSTARCVSSSISPMSRSISSHAVRRWSPCQYGRATSMN